MKVLIIKVFGVLLLFVLSIFLTNNFDPNLIGQYDFARSILMIVGGISILGTNQSIIFYSGNFKAQGSFGLLKKVYIKMLFLITIASSVLLLIMFLIPDNMLNILFGKPEASTLISKVVYAIALYAIAFLNIDMIRALNKTILSEFFRSIFRYLPFFLIAIFLVYSDNEIYLVNAYLLSFIILALSSLAVVFNLLSSYDYENSGNVPSYSRIFSKSYPMAISAMSFFLMQSVDILLLTKYSTFENVAYYAVAVKLSTITTLALMSVNIIIAPKIAEMFTNRDNHQLRRLLKNSNRLILALSVPIIVILAMFSEWILRLFGSDYVSAQWPLLILLLGQLFSALCGPVGVYMNMTEKQTKLQRLLIFGLLLNIIFNVVSIPNYGMLGAALSTALSMVIWKILAIISTYRKDKIKVFIS